MARYAIIEDATKKVANIIELKDGAKWSPPSGHTPVQSDIAGPGDTYDGSKFTPEVVVPVVNKLAEQLNSAATVDDLKVFLEKALKLG